MNARASMADLIQRVRVMINDAAAEPVFSDLEIQEALDRHRRDRRYEPLEPAETMTPGGGMAYLDYYAARGDWEDDVSLVDGGYNPVTPTTSDLSVGRWTFAEEPRRPVMAVGKVYDLYGAAADVLEAWAARVALDFDFHVAGQTFRGSQKQAQLLELAQQYRWKQRPAYVTTRRTDEVVDG